MVLPLSPASRRPHVRRWSLAARMAALVIVPSLLVMVLGGWWLRYEVHASLLGSMSRTLEEKSERINARLALLPDGKVQEAAGGSDEFSAIFSGWYWQLQGQAPAQLRTAAAPVVLARSRSLWDQRTWWWSRAGCGAANACNRRSAHSGRRCWCSIFRCHWAQAQRRCICRSLVPRSH